jgi:hypothetical protein
VKHWIWPGDFIEYWSQGFGDSGGYWLAFSYRSLFRGFHRYAWGWEKPWCGCRWALFLGWFVIARRNNPWPTHA